MDDLGVPLFLETPIYTYMYTSLHTKHIPRSPRVCLLENSNTPGASNMDQPYGGSYPYVSWVFSEKMGSGKTSYTWLLKIPKTMAL